MLSDLQQMIGEKEAELARMRQAATNAARHQEEEARTHLLDALASAELEVREVQKESQLAVEAAVRQAETDAAAHIERAKAEMEQEMQRREEEIFDAAGSKLEAEWALREASLQDEFRTVLVAELDDQQRKLTAHYDAIVKEKENAIKAQEERTKQQLTDIEEEHKRLMENLNQKTDQVAQEVWNEAREKFGAAADEEIAHNLALAEEHCIARDEQITVLLEERAELQKLLGEKETLLQDSVRDLGKLEKALEDAKSDARNNREKEAAKLSEEVICLMKDNEQLQQALHGMEAEYKLIEGELGRCRSEQKALEKKCAGQKEAASTFDSEKKRLQSRINELSACKELLERQLADAKTESLELARTVEVLDKKRSEMEATTEQLYNEIAVSRSEVDDLQHANKDLNRKHSDAVEKATSLQYEKREYMREMEDVIKRKDRLLADTLESMNNGAKSRSEPVVVHLHGNKNDNANAPSGNERLASECNSLRSKVLQLQRENFRLESELMNARSSSRNAGSSSADVSDAKRKDVETLLQENNSLKTIVTMMRKEMETAASNKDLEGRDKGSLPTEMILEQQLVQCRSYLDLLLTKRTTASGGHGYRDDEVAFLRSKYQDLHRAADELRDENAKLHRQCNANAGRNDYDGPTLREQELIQRLEEATDEIESLLDENEKLMKLSNELKYELRLTSGLADVREPPPTQRRAHEQKSSAQESEQTMLDAILNDQSRSCDSESHEPEVACIGRKCVRGVADSRPSKTAYGSRPRTASDRATASQKESFKRMLSRKKKELAVEKTKIRNWNVKDRATNPYL